MKYLIAILALLTSQLAWANPPAIWNGTDAKLLNSGSLIIPGLASHGACTLNSSNKLQSIAPGANGNVLTSNGTDWVSQAPAGGSGTPGGVTGNIQYDNAGAFAGSNNLFWDIANSRLGIGTSVPSVSLDVNGPVRDRNLSTAGIVNTDASGNLGSASNASTFTTLFETIATTLGDIIYGGASGAPTRLAGNTTSAVQVLTSQGSSGLATAPTWQPISAIGISTDWSTRYSVTPNGAGTVSGTIYYSRQVGDSLQFRGYFTSGTVAASTLSVSMPSGLTIDSTKFGSTSNVQEVGEWYQLSSASASSWQGGHGGAIFYDGSDTGKLYFSQTYASGAFTKANGSTLLANSDGVSFRFTVPISGWSSNTIGASQGAVYAHYYQSGTATPGANTQFNFDTRIDDSGALTGTPICVPGVGSFKCTAPVSGTYNLDVAASYSSGTGGYIQLYKNGSAVAYMGTPFGSSTGQLGLPNYPYSILLSAGDYIDFRPTTGATFAGSGAPYQTYMSMVLQSGNGAGNVSSNTTGSEHIERASITHTANSTCAISDQSGSWLSSVSCSSAGKVTLNIASGEYSSSTIDCTCNRVGTATGECAVNPTSSTTVDIYTGDSSGTPSNLPFSVHCMGPK